MTSDDRGRSLADQAASWVPPWERPAAAAPAAPTPEGAEGPADQAGPDPPADEVYAGPAAEEAYAGPAAEEVYAGPAAEEAYAGSAAEEAGEPMVADSAVPPAEKREVPRFDAALADAVLPDPALTDAAPPDAAAHVETPPAPLALIADAELRGALEAILLVVEEPVSEVTLAQVLEQPTERVTALLAALVEEYASAGRGFELRRVAGGWRLYTRPEYAPYVERFVLDGQQLRLTQAALETLAVIAYRQPVTRSRISAIRGVNCDGVIRTLVSRGLVEECGAEPDSGAFLYRTTTLFLERLGLSSVEELPPLAPFLPDDVDEIADAPR